MTHIICGIKKVGHQPLEHNMTITEFYIERRVEMAMDRLDSQLIKGIITQEAYNTQVENLDYWASQQYKRIGEEA
jgi:hypothetical protein